MATKDTVHVLIATSDRDGEKEVVGVYSSAELASEARLAAEYLNEDNGFEEQHYSIERLVVDLPAITL